MASSVWNRDLTLAMPPPKCGAPCAPDCPMCQGTRLVPVGGGRRFRITCPKCKGKGRVEEAKNE